MDFYYDENIGHKHVCFRCIGDKFLKEEIRIKGKSKKCAYCTNKAKGYRLIDVALRVETAFETFYIRTANEMDGFEYAMHKDPEINYDWERKGDPVVDTIAEALQSEPEIAEDVQQVLDDKNGNSNPSDPDEETEFRKDSYYTSNETSDKWWHDQWEQFEKSLKTQNRFFNSVGGDLLKMTFRGIQEMSARGGRPIITTIGPGTAFESAYRARVFQSDDKIVEALKHPEIHIGPPPYLYASSGRMNARGISVFYGAIDEETALAEVRPPVGSQVIVGAFNIIRPLRVLDLTALPNIRSEGSIFDPAFAAELERITFLSNLTAKLTRPVMPDDEIFDYLPTQAVADFLSSEPPFEFDGILFPSAQVEGGKQNIVLFNKSSKVEVVAYTSGTDLSVQLWGFEESGPYRDYTVYIREPEEAKKGEAGGEKETSPVEEYFENLKRAEELKFISLEDLRPVTLKFVDESVRVHVIQAVKIISQPYHVHRWKFTDTPVKDD